MTTTIVTRGLMLALLLGLLGIIVLAVLERPIPDPLTFAVTSALTGMLGLLAPRPGEGGEHRADV